MFYTIYSVLDVTSTNVQKLMFFTMFQKLMFNKTKYHSSYIQV